jgi:hypothetical protein
MKSIFTILQDIEKLIYKVLMWVVLIPKTLVAITLRPTGMARYVKKELGEGESHFDEYISPVILLLVVALIPAVAALYLLPVFGTTITSPATDSQTTGRDLLFESQTDLKSTREGILHRHTWWVVKNKSDGPGFVEIYRDPPKFVDEKGLSDNNIVRGKFHYDFKEGGVYYVNVLVESVDPRFPEKPALEKYYSSIKVNVPVTLEQPISLPDPSTDKPTFESDTSASVALPRSNVSSNSADRGGDSLTSQVQKENTIFLALALMLPPLLFALAVKLFRGESIGENNLKENFYVQCYYFSPLSLAIWATYYARYFFTSDAYFYRSENAALQVLILPLLLAILWFIRTEVKEIEFERKTTTTKAMIIVLACLAVLGFAANILVSFSQYKNWIRLLAIQSYPVISLVLIAGFAIAWYRRRRANGESITLKNISWTAVTALVLFGTLRLLPVLFSESVQAIPAETQVAAVSTEIAEPTADILTTPTVTVSSTQVAVVDTPNPAPKPFYTEEFDTDLSSWFDFMTSGDPGTVRWKLEGDALAIQLSKRENKQPKYYLINNLFTNSDVKVEAVVTNAGNNSNGIGLICRYSDIGWYEVQFSSSQAFEIYVVDNVGIFNQGYNSVAGENYSKEIKSGLSKNEYAITCKGNVVTVYANGVQVGEFVDETFRLSGGKIGISVWLPDKFPVHVKFETVKVSEP